MDEPVWSSVWQNGIHSLVINGNDDWRHLGVTDETPDAPLEPDVNVSKTFFPLPVLTQNKRVFVLGKFIQPQLMFAKKSTLIKEYNTPQKLD
jgi:hypothetical protein